MSEINTWMKENVNSESMNSMEINAHSEAMKSIEMSQPPEIITSMDVNVHSEVRRVLRLFNRFFKGKSKAVKKEYIRIKIIRGLKRSIRKASVEKRSRKSIIANDIVDPRMKSALEDFKKCYLKYSRKLDIMAKTYYEPLSNANTKKKRNNEGVAKSFNNSYVYDFFEPQEIREILFYYIEYLFADKSPEVLKKKLDVQCCNGQLHTIECEIKWISLKSFFNSFMLQELGLQAWYPSQIPTKYIELASYRPISTQGN